MLYRLQVNPHARSVRPVGDDWSLAALTRLLRRGARTATSASGEAAEIRVTVDAGGTATVRFAGFPGGDFTAQRPDERGHRDPDAVRRGDHRLPRRPGRRLLQRPARLLPLDQLRAAVLRRAAGAAGRPRAADPEDAARARGQHPVQLRPRQPAARPRRQARPAPPARYTWEGDSFAKDADGNYRFVYSGEDAQAGINVNAIILEVPLSVPHRAARRRSGSSTSGARAGCARLRRRSRPSRTTRSGRRTRSPCCAAAGWTTSCRRYKLVDTVGSAVRRRRPQRARGQPAAGRQQLLARARVRPAPGAPRLGLRPVGDARSAWPASSTTTTHRCRCTGRTRPRPPRSRAAGS